MRRRYPEAPIAAVAGLLIADTDILLARRRNPPHAGKWSFPGGVQELGETVQEALRREVREETGLEVADLRLLDVGDILIHDEESRIQYHYVITYFLAHPGRGTPTPGDDIAAVRWFSGSDVAELGVSQRFLSLVESAIELSKYTSGYFPKR